VQGSRLQAKAWVSALPEPDFWQISATDTSLSRAGATGVRIVLQDPTTEVAITQFVAKEI
jgi:hypothetical protein